MARRRALAPALLVLALTVVVQTACGGGDDDDDDGGEGDHASCTEICEAQINEGCDEGELSSCADFCPGFEAQVEQYECLEVYQEQLDCLAALDDLCDDAECFGPLIDCFETYCAENPASPGCDDG